MGGGGRGFGGGGSRGFGGRTGGSRSGGFNQRGSSGNRTNRGITGGVGMFRGPVMRPYRPYRPFRPFFRPMRGPGMGCSGCALPIMVIAFVILAIALISVFSAPGGGSGVTPSTIEREPLPPGSVVETGYYTDELGWIRNGTQLTAGMKNFYQQTGVQPYLYLTDNINGSPTPSSDEVEEFAFALYDELFVDEAHLLLIFLEYQEQYSTWYVTGTQANSVIDTEAADILLDYIDRYYHYDNLSDEEFFSKSFNDAGERIMTVTTSPWIPVLIVAGIIVILLIGFFWWKKRKEQKNREAEQTKEILNTPLDTFGDSKVDELADKYNDDENKNDN